MINYLVGLYSLITYVLAVLRRSLHGLYRVLASGTRSGVGVTFCKIWPLPCIVAAFTLVSPIGLVFGTGIECHR